MRRSLSVAILLVLALALFSMRSDAALMLKAHGGFRSNTNYFLLHAGGHVMLNSGGSLLCHTC